MGLERAFAARDIEAYAGLLGREFIFHFLPEDAGDIPDGEWNRDEDSTLTRCLFLSPDVSRIALDLVWEPVRADILRGEAVVSYRAHAAYTVATGDGNTTIRITASQLLYAQGGDEPGEDPGRYYLVDVEWLDPASGRAWVDLRSRFCPPGPRTPGMNPRPGGLH